MLYGYGVISYTFTEYKVKGKVRPTADDEERSEREGRHVGWLVGWLVGSWWVEVDAAGEGKVVQSLRTVLEVPFSSTTPLQRRRLQLRRAVLDAWRVPEPYKSKVVLWARG